MIWEVIKMKKILIACILLTLAASMMAVAFSSSIKSGVSEQASVAIAGYGKALTVFSDGFESYSVGSFPSSSWTLVFNGAGNSYQYVTDTVHNSGSKSFHMLGINGWAAEAYHYFTSASDTLGYIVYVRSGSLPSTKNEKVGPYVGFTKQTSSTTGDWYASVLFYDNGTIRAGGRIIGTFTPNTWYKVQVILYRPANIFFVFINNSFKGSFQAAENTYKLYQMTSFGLDSDHANMDAYFDDVTLFTAG
jgi:hypothetical protein